MDQAHLKTVALRRAGNRQWVLKPQDLAVALQGRWLPYGALGEAMHLSRFEAHAAVQRLLAARLAVDFDGQPRPLTVSLQQFVVYGAAFAYPAVRGEMTIGFPTAYSVSPLKEQLVATDEPPPVWPHPLGVARGSALLPLYPSLPLAAAGDPALYEMLALFDALRIGRARERALAKELLQSLLQ